MDSKALLTVILVVLLLTAAAIVAVAARRNLQRRREVAEAKRRTEAWKAANAPLPPLTDAEIEAFTAWHERQALPAAVLTLGDPVEPSATGSHVGGLVLWPVSKPWPQGKDGQPLQFLAQIDFASLPPLPDFPEKGVLQFFIGADDLFGADFDDVTNGSFHVAWWPEGVVGGKKTMSPKAGEDCTPLSPELRAHARKLVGSSAKIHPHAYTLPVERHPDQVLKRENAQRVIDIMDDRSRDGSEVHRVGGHPEFTQQDFRDDPRFEAYDRVLLQLWSTPHDALMWGDMGQGNFMIRRQDLLARDFSKITFHWDCS